MIKDLNNYDFILGLIREELRPTDYKIALYLFLRLNFETFEVINQKKISDDLDIALSNVNASLDYLLQCKFIEKHKDRVGRHRKFRLLKQSDVLDML